MRWPSVLPALLLVVVGACGGGDRDQEGGVVGRVTVLDGERACVSPDRGETATCIEGPTVGRDAVEGLEVGVCAELDTARRPDPVRVVDDVDCAAGDLGD